MMYHPDTMLEIVRQRQQDLLASSEPFITFAGPGKAARFLRRQIGQTLIRLGTWLGGSIPAPTPPTQLSSPQA